MKNKLIVFLTLLPALWVAVLIAKYAQRNFQKDQYAHMLPIIAKSLNGELKFDDVFQPHGEHRLVVPTLIMLGLAHVTHWDCRVEIWVQFLLAAGVLFNIEMIRKKAGGSIWLIPFSSMLIFSPLAYENWMLGFQIHFWLPVFCITALGWACNARGYLFTVPLLCTVATYSLASGFVSWIIAFGLMLSKKDDHGKPTWKDEVGNVLGLSIVAMVATFFYFYELKSSYRPLTAKPYTYALTHLREAIPYFVSYFGNGFSKALEGIPDFQVGFLIGCVLLLLFGVAVHHAWKLKCLSRVAPWIALCICVFTFAAMTTAGRIEIKTLESRYITFIVMFYIGLFGMLSQFEPKPSKIIGIVLTILHLGGCFICEKLWMSYANYAIQIGAITRAVNCLPTDKDAQDMLVNSVIVHLKDPARTLADVRTLNLHGYIQPPLVLRGEKPPPPSFIQQ